jgi:PAS domain S-box-containing protein
MYIEIVSLAWAILSLFVIALSLSFFYLFLLDRDLRKIMVSLGMLSSAFSFLFLAVTVPSVVENEAPIFSSIYRWGMIPTIICLFFILLDRLYYRKKDFKVIFSLFIFFYFFSFLLFLSNSVSPLLYSVSVQIGALISIILSIHLIYKARNSTSWLFLFSICIFSLGGISLNVYVKEPANNPIIILALTCFFLAYIFLSIIFRFNISPQKIEDQGIGVYFSLQNRLKKVEEALEESQQRYRWVVENFQQGIFVINQNATIIYTNKFFMDMVGFTPSEILNKPLFDFLDQPSITLLQNTLHGEAQKQGEEFETTLIKKDKTRISTRFSITPYINESERIGTLITVQDITTQKKIENELQEKIGRLQKSEIATLNIMEDLQGTIIDLQKAKEEINDKNEALQSINEELNTARDQLSQWNEDLEKKIQERTIEIQNLLQQKDDFINQLGHDLKTPLTPLNTLLPLVKQRENDPKIIELLDICIGNVNYMKNLVIKTLELARLNSPNTTFATTGISLLDELNEILQQKKPVFIEHHINIDNHIANHLIVEADPIQIKEVFDNLIINAVKYSKPEGTFITIDAKEDADDVVVSIKDNGIGLSRKQLEQIFTEFYKADQSRHDLESTGLGLPICKRIIEKHGGKIWAESPGLDKGCTFYFTLKKGIKGVGHEQNTAG